MQTFKNQGIPDTKMLFAFGCADIVLMAQNQRWKNCWHLSTNQGSGTKLYKQFLDSSPVLIHYKQTVTLLRYVFNSTKSGTYIQT